MTIILFGAISVQDPIKGGQFLLNAMHDICKKDPSVLLVCFGHGDISFFSERNIECISVGRICKKERLVALYRAADVFVCPSIIENLPNKI